MRTLLAAVCCSLMSMSAVAQDFKKEVGPIKVIDLKRKEPVSYEKEVEPIFYKRCTVCHSGTVLEGKLDISSYENLMKGGKSGQLVKPGKGDESILYKAMGRSSIPPARPRAMPPKGDEPCSAEELALVKLWIDQGAKAPSGIRELPVAKPTIPHPDIKVVRGIAVSPDKSVIAAGRSNQIHIYDAGSGAHVRSLIAPDLKTPDGKDVKAAHLSIVESMAWSPDGKYLISGSFREIAVWDALTGELRHKITGFAHEVVAITFSPDGNLLGTGGGAPTQEGEVKVFEVGTWKLVTDIKACHSDTVYGLAFSPAEVKIVDPKAPPVKDPKDAKLITLGQMLATCSSDKFVKVWSIPDGKHVKSFEGHTHHVLDVGWMSDGKQLASAGGDNTVKVWDFEKGEQARTINAHAKQVTRLLFIGKKAEFLTTGGDNLVKRFNINGGVTGTFGGGTDYIYAVGCSSDGAVVAAGGEDGIVRVYNGANATMTRTLVPPGAQSPMKEEKKK